MIRDTIKKKMEELKEHCQCNAVDGTCWRCLAEDVLDDILEAVPECIHHYVVKTRYTTTFDGITSKKTTMKCKRCGNRPYFTTEEVQL